MNDETTLLLKVKYHTIKQGIDGTEYKIVLDDDGDKLPGEFRKAGLALLTGSRDEMEEFPPGTQFEVTIRFPVTTLDEFADGGDEVATVEATDDPVLRMMEEDLAEHERRDKEKAAEEEVEEPLEGIPDFEEKIAQAGVAQEFETEEGGEMAGMVPEQPVRKNKPEPGRVEVSMSHVDDDGKPTGSPWPEDLDVKDSANPLPEIMQVLDNYNNTLRSGERPRVFIEILKVDEGVTRCKWSKSNLVTTSEGCDILVCDRCGDTYNRFQLGDAGPIQDCEPDLVCKEHKRRFKNAESKKRHDRRFHRD